MSHEPEPLDADLLAALRAAEPPIEAPGDVRSRVLSSVEGRIADLPRPPDGGDQSRGRAGHASEATTAFTLSGPWLLIPAALVLGGAIGGLLRGPGPERVVYVDRVTPSTRQTGSLPAPDQAPAATAIPVESLPVVTASPPRPVPSPVDSSGQQLAAESMLLDLAHTSIARGEAERALAAVARHGTQFPHGMLSEEREALAVKALVLAGERDAARARAAQFHAHYPESLFLAAVDAAMRGLR